MMDDFLSDFFEETENPLDSFEAYLLTQECLFKRAGWDRLILDHPSRFCKLRQEFHYVPQDEYVTFKCFASDLILDPDYEVLSAPFVMKMNREQAIGHFELSEAGHFMFKHTISLPDKDDLRIIEELEELRKIAQRAFERRYAALTIMQAHLKRLSDAGFVMEMDDFLPAQNDNRSAREPSSMNLAFMDTHGEG